MSDQGQPRTPDPQWVNLLNQVLTRLDRMEGGLSQHEQWLRRIEQEQSPELSTEETVLPEAVPMVAPPMLAPAMAQAEPEPVTAEVPQLASRGPELQELERLVGSLTLERDRVKAALGEAQQHLGKYQQDLQLARRQLAEQQKQQTELARQSAVVQRSVAGERDQARTRLADVEKQLASHEQRAEAAERQLKEARAGLEQAAARLAEQDQRFEEMRRRLDQAAARFDHLAQQTRSSAEERRRRGLADESRWPNTARIMVAAVALLAVAAAIITGSLYEAGRPAAAPRDSGLLLTTGGEALIGQCRRQLEAIGAKVTRQDLRAGLLEFDSPGDPDSVGQAIVAAFPPSTQPTATPEQLDARNARAGQIAKLDRILSTAPASAPALAARSPELTRRWGELRRQRDQMLASMAAAEQRLRQLAPTLSEITLTPAQLADCQAADRRLQADIEALAQRQDQLAARLRAGLQSVEQQLGTFDPAVVEADNVLGRAAGEDHHPEVISHLKQMREVLSTWSKNSTAFGRNAEHFRAQMNALPPPDWMAVQTGLEAAARALAEGLAAGRANLDQHLKGIGEGQEQMTKRLVLQTALTRDLAGLASAEQAMVSATTALVAAQDVELAAILQRLSGLRERVTMDQQELIANVRQARLAELQQAHEKMLAQAGQERSQLEQQLASNSTALLQLATQAVAAAGESGVQLAALADQLDLHRRRARLLTEAVQDVEAATAEAPLAGSAPPVRYLRIPAPPPADLEMPRLPRAVLTALAPLLMFLVASLIVWMMMSSRRTERVMESYARSLRAAAGQPAKPASPTAPSAPVTRAKAPASPRV